MWNRHGALVALDVVPESGTPSYSQRRVMLESLVPTDAVFSGEIRIARKHTGFILRDMPFLTQQAIGRLMDRWHHQDERISAYKTKAVNDRAAHDLIIRATDVGVCSNRLIPSVLQQWRKPKHEEFEQRNVWALFNAFTESLKDGNLSELPKRTEALHGLLDTHVGLN
jgi:hypothetical protein